MRSNSDAYFDSYVPKPIHESKIAFGFICLQGIALIGSVACADKSCKAPISNEQAADMAAPTVDRLQMNTIVMISAAEAMHDDKKSDGA